MTRLATLLLLLAWLSPAGAVDRPPAKGTFLVATDEVRGAVFARTVILLLHYDESGAMGIVVNRPTEIPPAEVLADADAFAGYDGEFFWGGPVQMELLWALMLTDDPPEGAEAIVDGVHQVPIDKAVALLPADPSMLRFFMGYAGWSAGQLDSEMARGSWHVVTATSEHVFSDDPRELWKQLAPAPAQYRAYAQ